MTEAQNAQFPPSPWRSSAQGGLSVGLYCLLSVIGLHLDNLLSWLPIWSAQAVILSGFLSASHEALHRSLYRTSQANEVAGVFWSIPVLQNFSLYRHRHLAHHAFLMSARDTKEYPDISSATGFVHGLITAVPRTTHLPELAASFFGISAIPETSRRRLRARVRRDFFFLSIWLAFVCAALIFHPEFVGDVYIAPLFIFNIANYLTVVPEHCGTHAEGALLEKVRTIRSNTVFRLLYWNGNFHAEHHLWPNIPFYALPQAHALLRDKLIYYEPSYTAFYGKVFRNWLRKDR